MNMHTYYFWERNQNRDWRWRWWHQIQAIFLNLFYFISAKAYWLLRIHSSLQDRRKFVLGNPIILPDLHAFQDSDRWKFVFRNPIIATKINPTVNLLPQVTRFSLNLPKLLDFYLFWQSPCCSVVIINKLRNDLTWFSGANIYVCQMWSQCKKTVY